MIPPVIDPDFDKETLRFLEQTCPRGVRLVMAADDPPFVQSMREIYHVSLPDDLVMMASDGRNTWAVIPPTTAGPGLMLTFSLEGDGVVALTPTLVTSRPQDFAQWTNRDSSAQAAISAWENLLFRRFVPSAGGVM